MFAFLVGILAPEGYGPGPKTIRTALDQALRGDLVPLAQLLEWRIAQVAMS